MTDSTVQFFDDPCDLAVALLGVEGSTLLSTIGVYEEDALRMNQTQRLEGEKKARWYEKTGKKKGRANPYTGSGVRKESRSQQTVNFNYDQKVERRDGEQPESKGNHAQAVIIKGKVTPLSTHKADVICEPIEGAKQVAKGGCVIDGKRYAYPDVRAVMDENGSVQFKTDQTPRLYLRCEYVRLGDADDRNERTMKTISRYLRPHATKGEVEVNRKRLAEFLPARRPRKDQTDMQTIALDNIVEIRFSGMVWRRSGKIVPEFGALPTAATSAA